MEPNQLKQLFQTASAGKGFIDLNGLTNLVKELGYGPDEAKAIMQQLDVDGNEQLTFEEFWEGFQSFATASSDQLEEQVENENEILMIFNFLDKDKDSTVDTNEAVLLYELLRNQLSWEDFQLVLHQVDKDGNGTISFDEFIPLGKILLSHGITVKSLMEHDLNNQLQHDIQIQQEKDFERKMSLYTKTQLEEMRTIFDVVDADGNGSIDQAELKAALRQLGKSANEEEVEALMTQLDTDKSGTITFVEFVEGIGSWFVEAHNGPAETLPNMTVQEIQEVKRVFSIIDRNGDGFLSEEEIKQVLKELGRKITAEESKKFVQELDIDNDGRITLDEFLEGMSRLQGGLQLFTVQEELAQPELSSTPKEEKDNVFTLTSMNDALKAKCTMLESAYENLDKEHSTLLAELTGMRKEVLSLRKLKKELATLHDNNEELQQTVEDLTKQIQELNKIIQRLKKSNAELREANEQLEQQLSNQHDSFEKSLVKQQSDKSRDFQKQSAEIEEKYYTMVQNSEMQIKKLQEVIHKYKSENERLTTMNSHLESVTSIQKEQLLKMEEQLEMQQLQQGSVDIKASGSLFDEFMQLNSMSPRPNENEIAEKEQADKEAREKENREKEAKERILADAQERLRREEHERKVKEDEFRRKREEMEASLDKESEAHNHTKEQMKVLQKENVQLKDMIMALEAKLKEATAPKPAPEPVKEAPQPKTPPAGGSKPMISHQRDPGFVVPPHKLTSEEKKILDYVNHVLSTDVYLSHLLPLSDQQSELLLALQDGVVLCKLVNFAVPGTIDERVIKYHPRNETDVSENHVLFINSAIAIGCSIYGLTAQEILDGNITKLFSVMYELVRISLMQPISLYYYPQLVALAPAQEIRSMVSEQILMTWVNYHLQKAAFQPISNFNSDVKEGKALLCLLKQLVPEQFYSLDVVPESPKDFAKLTADVASKTDCNYFISEEDVLQGNSKMIILFAALLFQKHPNLELKPQPMPARKESVAKYNPDDGSREERGQHVFVVVSELLVYLSWILSLNIPVKHIVEDLRDGIKILKVVDQIAPGHTNWKKIVDPKNHYEKLQNTNYCVEVLKSLNITIIGIAGQDLLDGNRKFIFAILWQLMQLHIFAILQKAGSFKGQKLTEADMIKWANTKVAQSGKRTSIKDFKDKSLATGKFLIDLLQSINPKAVDPTLVTEGITDKQKMLNAKYGITVARKMGCCVFLLWEDIVEVKPKMILTFVGALMAL